MKEITNDAVRAAIDDCLSGAGDLPSVRAAVLNQARGESQVKKKISVSVIFAMLLTMLMAGAALAAGLGLFGQMSESGAVDARLPGLERVSADVNLSIVTEEGVTVTIGQAYYDGERVFISYTVEGPFDQVELGEGKPAVDAWDWELPGEVYGQTFGSDSASHDLMVAHLDGSAPRWATSHSVNVHDGLQIGETYLDIIGGEMYLTENGTLVGWKECVVPEELAADEVTFLLGTFTTHNTWYQDETGCYLSRGERTGAAWHPFTVQRDKTGGVPLTGEASGEGWTAVANLNASAIDVKGEVVVTCPQSWVEIERTWENPDDIDYIREWRFYIGDQRVTDGGTEWVSSGVDGQLTVGVSCKLDALVENMQLVPVYSRSGEHMEEAIVLRVVE
ncbi:MAG: DUF4179 domain-containing protein [Clostridia bacterium]|nr:DUF4179 domain-containing protein [Clostridia bacterium]